MRRSRLQCSAIRRWLKNSRRCGKCRRSDLYDDPWNDTYNATKIYMNIEQKQNFAQSPNNDAALTKCLVCDVKEFE